MNDAGQSICLCMIVKNELPVIDRCLGSLHSLIDTWVIVDTGSTDGTQQRIRENLKDIAGELFERPWINFAHNRSEALLLARRRADYVLIIDADEVLELSPGFRLPRLTADAYSFKVVSGQTSYDKVQLARDALDWKFVGVMHEHIFCDGPHTQERLPGVRTLRFHDGARARDPLTYRRDALILEEALLLDPGNARHMFYLAQSYADAGEHSLAIDRYTKRVAMGGWAEEVWYSLFKIATLKQALNAPWPEVLCAYLAAFSFRGDRVEPLFQIGFHYQAQKEFGLAYLFFSRAMDLPFPQADVLFVEHHIYDVLLPIEFSVSCFYVGRHDQAIRTANRMLERPDFPADMREQVIRNREFSLEALYPKRSGDAAAAGRIVLCIDAQDPGYTLDRCIESLFRQTHTDFQAVFVFAAGDRDRAARLPLQDRRFLPKVAPEPMGWIGVVKLASAEASGEFAAAAASRQSTAAAATGEFAVTAASGKFAAAAVSGEFAAAQARGDAILYPIRGCDWLPDPRSLEHIAAHFASYDCALMLGQFRSPNGDLGDALPPASPQDLESDPGLYAGAAVLPFRKSLLQNADLSDNADPRQLLLLAGFSRIRFSDRPILVKSSVANVTAVPESHTLLSPA